MERLLIDFSQIYGQNETQRAAKSVYNTQVSPLRASDITQETPRISGKPRLAGFS